MKLYKHQKIELELLENNKGFAILSEQGTGKTLPMLVHICNLLMYGEINNALIITTCSAIGSWYRDINKFDNYKKNILLENVTIINYEKISSKKNRNKYYTIWGAIVLDESQAIAYRSSNRTKFMVGYNRGSQKVDGLNKLAKYKYILTGTPISNKHLEMYYSQMDFIKPGIFGTYNEFRAKYLKERMLPGTYVSMVVGYRNKEEMLKIVGNYSYRVLKKECLDLPEKLEDEMIEVPLGAVKQYKEATKQFISDFDMAIPNALSQMSKLRQIPNGHVKDEYGDTHELPSEKNKYLLDLIDRIGIEDNKVCIFAYYKKSIDNISKALDEKKINHIILDGNQKDKLIWRNFQSDEKIRVIICQWKSACAGIDLFASSNMIMYEPDLSSTIVEQARDRIHRIGQHSPCNYYWLITKDTIEEDIYKKLKKCEDFNEEAMQKIVEVYKNKKV